MRERLPLGVISRDVGRGLVVDALMAVDERSFYVEGWLYDEEAPVVRLTAVSPEGERVDIHDRLFRYRRPDVEKFYDTPISRRHTARLGYICFFQLGRASRLRNGWILEMENADGAEAEIRAPTALQDLADVRKRVLEGLPPAFGSDELMELHVHPAIQRLQERAAQLVAVQEVIEYGAVPDDPEVSVVVPLYRRIDFLEHQLAQFAHDAEMEATELVYVLDSPELGQSLTEKAVQLHELYRIPFRLVLLERNSGFAAANNSGASTCKGPLLLFMNSDILPDRPGWLRRMIDFYGSKPNVGALGPKLLYEDDSLQHAGMYFTLPTASALAGLWANWHYFKGLHRNLPAANVARPVPAVTGACLMVARDLFEGVGGFQNTYVQGDHEDSDLCLRLIDERLENWYLPEVELYHLEARSYPSDIRERTVLYNRWVHTQLWGDRIREVMEQQMENER
ncbi:MAG: glycosyltransferase family 2 protein [Gemmatimonadota bacterium]